MGEALIALITLLLLPLAALWLLPFFSDFLSLLVRPDSPAAGTTRPAGTVGKLLFVVPAHQEEALVGGTVSSLMAMRGEPRARRIVVVADNCTDMTAAHARQAGAEVLERDDPTRPGKPAAIAWLLERITLAEFDAVVIVDADTKVDAGFASALAARAPLRDRVVQAHFGSANPGESWLTRLASLFEDVRYLGQFPLKARAGLNVVLTGNGMCLGTGVLKRMGWVTDALTEDLELYTRYTLAGVRIDFAPEAKLYAQEARDLRQATVQRRRWQAGKVAALRKYFVPIVLSGKTGLRQKVDLLAELSFPGPVAHAAIAAAGSTLLLASPALPRLVGLCFAVSLVPTLVWTAIALARRDDRGQLLVDLLRLPGYALWRLTTTLGVALGARSPRWERSPRHRSE